MELQSPARAGLGGTQLPRADVPAGALRFR